MNRGLSSHWVGWAILASVGFVVATPLACAFPDYSFTETPATPVGTGAGGANVGGGGAAGTGGGGGSACMTDADCAGSPDGPYCAGGVCTASGCEVGFVDCNQDMSDGCEVDTTTDPANCGACGNQCEPLANAMPGCTQGACMFGPCLPSFGDCDGLSTNGCEVNIQVSPMHCGSCGYVCDLLNANETCQAGACVITTCNAGFADCDGVTTTGCEVHTQSDVNHCGVCDNMCSFPGGTTSCQVGSCVLTSCLPPNTDCNAMPSDGCEINTKTDIDNCGSCGNACALPNATEICAAGMCELVSCDPGWQDCDANTATGCEVNVTTSVTDCGACGVACSANNGTPSCMAGMCSIVCSPGYDDCDGLVSNGCEVNTSNNVQHCGTCGNVCPGIGGTPNCVGGMCGIANCMSPLGDCDGIPGNGCEVNTSNNVQHCGACGNVCFVANASTLCSSSMCVVASCNPGFDNCNGQYPDGCETPLNTTSDCGACSQPCVLPNANETCATGMCTLSSCVGNFADCDGLPGNGCEVNTDTHVSHCGLCGHACSTVNGTPSCSGGVCGIMCSTGFGNCDADADNGCEHPVTSDINNCGACGNVCTVANGTPGCSSACIVQGCNAPYANCDGLYATGCEANTTTNVNHCGACGTACTNANGTTICAGGVCSPACSAGWVDCDGNPNNGCETLQASCASCPTPCTLASGLVTPRGIALDGQYVYVTDFNGGKIIRVLKSGGTPTTLLSGQNQPWPIAVDTAGIYWGNYGGRTVHQAQLNGMTPILLASTNEEPLGIAVDSATIFWTEYSLIDGAVKKIMKGGGAVQGLAINIDYPRYLVTDATDVYWTDDDAPGFVAKIPKGGGTTTILATSQNNPEGIVRDGTYVYFTLRWPDGMVKRVNAAGGGLTTLVTGQYDPSMLAVDATHLYWIDYNQGNGKIMRSTKTGSTVTPMAVSQAGPYGLAVDDTGIYWTNASNGTVMRLDK